MERGFKAGAMGFKLSKILGHTAKDPDGSYNQADDPRLDAGWAMAAKYILMGSDGNLNRGVEEFWTPHWRTLETYDECFDHPAQIRLSGGSPGHGRWNISGLGLPDDVLRNVYYLNALRHLPLLQTTVEKQLSAR
jgi:hypothetical protein